MKRIFYISILLVLITGAGYTQLSSFNINKQTFVKPTVESFGYLMENVDTSKWNEVLLPLKYQLLPAHARVHSLEYKKATEAQSQYIGFDDRYWVLTIIWKDATGKILVSKDLKKSLKGKEHSTPGFYKVEYKGMNLIIGIETLKEKEISEMITVEIERK